MLKLSGVCNSNVFVTVTASSGFMVCSPREVYSVSGFVFLWLVDDLGELVAPHDLIHEV